MSMSDQVKALAENIEASHDARTAAIANIVKETHQKLESFHREHEEMAGELRQFLASDKEARRTLVQQIRAENRKEMRRRASEIAEFLSTAERERREEFAAMMREIKDTTAAIKEHTANMLAGYRSEHKEMADELHSWLAELAADRRQARAIWENLARTMAAKRTGKGEKGS